MTRLEEERVRCSIVGTVRDSIYCNLQRPIDRARLSAYFECSLKMSRKSYSFYLMTPKNAPKYSLINKVQLAKGFCAVSCDLIYLAIFWHFWGS